MEDMDSLDLVALIAALILPPIAVLIKVGLTTQFWLNILLTVFGFHIFGVIHALYIVVKK